MRARPRARGRCRRPIRSPRRRIIRSRRRRRWRASPATGSKYGRERRFPTLPARRRPRRRASSEREVTLYPMPVGDGSAAHSTREAIEIAVDWPACRPRPVSLSLPPATAQNQDAVRPPMMARLAALPRPAAPSHAWSGRWPAWPGSGRAGRAQEAFAEASRLRQRPALWHSRISGSRASSVEAADRTGYMRGGDEPLRASPPKASSTKWRGRGAPSRWPSASACSAARRGWRGRSPPRRRSAAGTAARGAARMGLACASGFGSHIGLLAEASIGADQRIKVTRLVAAVDAGRIVNPGLVGSRSKAGCSPRWPRAVVPAPEFIAGMPRARRSARSAAERLQGPAQDRGRDHRAARAPGGVSGLGMRGARPGGRQCARRRRPASACAACRSTRWRGMTAPADHPAIAAKVGVLLINLGTPDAPEPSAVRRYLAEFLSDPRVIEIPRLAWKPILHGIILRTRPKKSRMPMRRCGPTKGSPLAAITRSAGGARCGKRLGDGVIVDWAMRYGNPGSRRAIERMVAAWLRRASSSRRSIRNIARRRPRARWTRPSPRSRAMRWQPALRTLPPYYDDPLYIGALKANLERQLAALDFEPERLLLSFHGMPQRTLELGDPYHCHCQQDRAAAGRSAWIPGRCRLPVALRPRQMARAGDRRDVLRPIRRARRQAIAIAAPGFSADCLETLEELGIRGRETSSRRRRRISRGSIASTTARRDDDARRADPPRTCRMVPRPKRAPNKTGESHGTSGDRHRRNARHRRGDQHRAQGHGHEGRRDLCRQ
jgi:ferrochelatase